MERQSNVLDEVGGEKGIQKLKEAAAGAGDVADAVAASEEIAESAQGEAAAARKEVEEAGREADAAKKEADAAKKEAAAAEEAAGRLAADKVGVGVWMWVWVWVFSPYYISWVASGLVCLSSPCSIYELTPLLLSLSYTRRCMYIHIYIYIFFMY